MLITPKTLPLVGILAATLATPALASIEGTYVGSMQVGVDGGAAYSYIHESTAAKKSGDAGYFQKAGGAIIFAIDTTDAFSLKFNDNGSDGLTAGDTIDLDIMVNLLQYDGTRDGANSLPGVVGTLRLNGSLTVGGANHSGSFSDGIYNITAGDQDASFGGLDYTIDVTNNFSINSNDYFAGDQFTGDAFFQSADLAGPFNGVGYDAATKTLTFAVWGDSRNMDANGDPNNTGSFTAANALVGGDSAPLGFDIFVEAQIVPEASSVLVWTLLLTCVGLASTRRA